MFLYLLLPFFTPHYFCSAVLHRCWGNKGPLSWVWYEHRLLEDLQKGSNVQPQRRVHSNPQTWTWHRLIQRLFPGRDCRHLLWLLVVTTLLLLVQPHRSLQPSTHPCPSSSTSFPSSSPNSLDNKPLHLALLLIKRTTLALKIPMSSTGSTPFLSPSYMWLIDSEKKKSLQMRTLFIKYQSAFNQS